MTERGRKTGKAPADSARATAIVCARAADDKRAADISVLDVRKIVSFADYLVIATAESHNQLDAVCDRVEEKMPATPRHREGGRGNPWRLLDFSDVVVNVFLRDTRPYYSLDRLYADARKVTWEEPRAVAPKKKKKR